jgi:hypothetical protein
VAVGGALAAWAAVRAVPPAVAKPGMVVQGGKEFDGDVDETSVPGKVVVTAKGGIKTTFDRRAVEKVTYFNSPKEEFDARMARLQPNDASGRLAVAKWAEDAKQYDLAKTALDQAKAIDANNVEVNALLDRVNKQVAASQPAVPTQPAAGDPGPGGGDKTTAAGAASHGMPIRQVTPEEINSIKQLEWRAGDRSVQTKVPPDIRKLFIDSGVLPPKEAAALQPNDLAMEILQRGTPAMKQQVQIKNDPAPMKEFKTNVEKTVQDGCVQCHTVGKVGKGNNFALFAGNTDADAYSNFLIIQQFTKAIPPDPKQPAKTIEYSMIDRLRPESSLLVEYALPPAAAALPHPEVKPPAVPYTGAIRGKSAKQYVDMTRWIGHLAPIAPDYGIDLSKPVEKPEKPAGKPPGAGAAAEPVAPPATRPAAPRPTLPPRLPAP